MSRGQAIENIKSAEKIKKEIEEELNKAEEIFNQHNNNLKIIQEKMMTIREKRAIRNRICLQHMQICEI